ncbi:dihydrodipicolinate synthase family protein [Paraburkholderia sp. Cy-641]|uniref:dihydrodipicolinate synthase family protein n=1 Tax=Paraburkholderia sp. Cy-641 TaxID=2608337 RepID=UPI0014232BF2|nr:dihydrodipicolinate synthase family protein [Paraburkholderia sp. Cy-641]NIF79592.1 dihydrodipicolinate synthase family protein [Paraburkholderia sp. Cy-641]
MTSSSHFQHVLSPVVTPFDESGAPSAERFIRHCRALLSHDVDLAVFGTNSEANSLSVGEKRGLLDALLAAGLPATRMMPGTGACALPDTIELTRHAVASGCAGVLMLPPFYYKNVSDEGLFRAYSRVIDAVGDTRLKVYLYHIPPVAQVGLSLSLVERLLKAYPGTIAGIKDSSGDWSNTSALIAEFAAAGFEVFAGSETFLLRTLEAGGAGCITATGNVNAAAIAQLARDWRAVDAPAQQRRLDETRAVFQRFPMIAAMKAAIAWQSGDAGWAALRAPLVELDTTQRARLESALTALGFRLPHAEQLALHAGALH